MLLRRVLWILLFFASMGHGHSCLIAPATAQDFNVDRSVVESWIFQRQNGGEQAKKSLVAQIDLKINAVKSFVELTDLQIQQLRLAAEGDIKRFYDEVQEVLTKVDAMEMNQNTVNEAYQLTLPLQQKLAGGIFDHDSLMHKVLRGTLTTEQLERLESAEKRRRQQVLTTLVKGFLTSLDRAVPMSADQLQKLTELLINETANDRLEGEYGTYVVGYRLSKVPSAELEAILKEPQIKVLRQFFAEMQGIEAFLRQQGMIVDKADVQ